MVHFHSMRGRRGGSMRWRPPLNLHDANLIEGRQYTIYVPILVLEGKRRYFHPPRIRTPAGVCRPQQRAINLCGGVQRFKLGLHGAELSIAGIVGYIQGQIDCHWFAEVNQWIDDLASSGEAGWSPSDRLDKFVRDPALRVSRCESEHSRTSGVSSEVCVAGRIFRLGDVARGIAYRLTGACTHSLVAGLLSIGEQ